MLKEKVRKNITRISGVDGPIKLSAGLDDFGDDLSTNLLSDTIALMIREPGVSGHMVATETLAEGNLVTNLLVTERFNGTPVGTGSDGPNRETGHATGLGDSMTIHAAA